MAALPPNVLGISNDERMRVLIIAAAHADVGQLGMPQHLVRSFRRSFACRHFPPEFAPTPWRAAINARSYSNHASRKYPGEFASGTHESVWNKRSTACILRATYRPRSRFGCRDPL